MFLLFSSPHQMTPTANTCLSNNEFRSVTTKCINTNVTLICIRDSVSFDNDVMVGQLHQTEFGKGCTDTNESKVMGREGATGSGRSDVCINNDISPDNFRRRSSYKY